MSAAMPTEEELEAARGRLGRGPQMLLSKGDCAECSGQGFVRRRFVTKVHSLRGTLDVETDEVRVLCDCVKHEPHIEIFGF